MTRTLVMTLGCLLAVSGAGSLPAAHAQGDKPWTTLLDGTTLDGWNVVGNANWAVADGAVQATQGSGLLVTPMSYGDFEMTVEFWVSNDANSGVFIRCQDPKTITSANSYEVNIYDTRPDPAYRTGAIVDVAKPMAMVNTGGKWNTIEISARGPRLIVTLNGTRTVDVEHKGHARGPIGLQYGAGTVKFRNVRIRAL